jgi:hypothetical protein
MERDAAARTDKTRPTGGMNMRKSRKTLAKTTAMSGWRTLRKAASRPSQWIEDTEKRVAILVEKE